MGAPLLHLNDRAQDTTRELADQLGPATVTRALEGLGQALVDMRQAPDPRVPLEVAALRLCRGPGAPPPAGQSTTGTAASAAGAGSSGTDPQLAARVAELERQVADLTSRLAGGAPSDNPTETTSAAGKPSTNTPSAEASAATPTPAAKPSGPAAAARNRLAEVAGQVPSSPRDGTDQGGSPPADQAGAATPPPRPPRAESSRAATDDASPAASTPPPTSDGPPAATASTEPATSEAAGAPSPGSVEAGNETGPGNGGTAGDGDRPSLSAALTFPAVNAAFAGCLDTVSQKTRVRFKGGRILDVSGSTVVFGVPNPIHRDRCHDLKGRDRGGPGQPLRAVGHPRGRRRRRRPPPRPWIRLGSKPPARRRPTTRPTSGPVEELGRCHRSVGQRGRAADQGLSRLHGHRPSARPRHPLTRKGVLR